MDAFGDVSGNFRGLIKGHCDVVVVGVVAGDRLACGKCPKRCVQRVDDIPEARWNDLNTVQKRRLFECFADNEYLTYGYAKFHRDHLHTLRDHYLLHDDVVFPPAWDLALTGYAYGEILFEIGARDDNHVVFEFDRTASKKQSKQVAEHVQKFVPEAQTFIKGSRQSRGVQAADCFAGAVAEDEKRDTGWIDHLTSEDIVSCVETSLVQLENDLVNV